jgi:hypothetical protein
MFCTGVRASSQAIKKNINSDACCQCGRRISSSRNRIRFQQERFICSTCYRANVFPEIKEDGPETVD